MLKGSWETKDKLSLLLALPRIKSSPVMPDLRYRDGWRRQSLRKRKVILPLDVPLHRNSFLDSSQVRSAATPLYCTFSVYECCCYGRRSNLAIHGISLRCRHIAVWWAATWIFLTVSLTLHTQTMYIHSVLVACHPAHLLGWVFARLKVSQTGV